MPKKLQHVGVSQVVTPLLYNQIIHPGHVLRLHDVDAAAALLMTYKTENGATQPRFVLVPDNTPHNFDLTMKFRASAGPIMVKPVDPALLVSPTAAMIADTSTVYQRNVAPFDRWISDGARLVATVQAAADCTVLAPGETAGYRPTRALFLQSIPLGIPSNGTVNSNGALTLATALPFAYPQAFLYFIAGALFPGSVAGFYYTEMSSTTVGVAFSNRYTAGPVIAPPVKTAIVSAPVGSYTQTTNSIATLAATVLANTLGGGGRLDIQGRLSYPNTVGNKSASVTFGGASLLNNAVPASTAGVEFELFVHNRGSAARQVLNTPGWKMLPGSAASAGYSTVDTTQSQTVSVSLALQTATDFVILETLSIAASFPPV